MNFIVYTHVKCLGDMRFSGCLCEVVVFRFVVRVICDVTGRVIIIYVGSQCKD